jgi:hypothetical protein
LIEPKRIFAQFLIALAMIAALPATATSSAVPISISSSPVRDVNSSSPSVWETGVADGAGIPGMADAKAEKSFAAESFVLFLVGVGLIFLAVIGRRKFQK